MVVQPQFHQMLSFSIQWDFGQHVKRLVVEQPHSEYLKPMKTCQCIIQCSFHLNIVKHDIIRNDHIRHVFNILKMFTQIHERTDKLTFSLPRPWCYSYHSAGAIPLRKASSLLAHSSSQKVSAEWILSQDAKRYYIWNNGVTMGWAIADRHVGHPEHMPSILTVLNMDRRRENLPMNTNKTTAWKLKTMRGGSQ